jgi:hypothetical protein
VSFSIVITSSGGSSRLYHYTQQVLRSQAKNEAAGAGPQKILFWHKILDDALNRYYNIIVKGSVPSPYGGERLC